MKRREDGLWYIGSHRIRWLPLAALSAVVVLTGALTVVAVKNRSADPDTVDCTRDMCVALTFDDGPTPFTDRLLRILTSDDAKATFFLVGNKVAADPASARRIADAGMEIGNHTWKHANMSTPARNLPITDIPNQNPGGPQ